MSAEKRSTQESVARAAAAVCDATGSVCTDVCVGDLDPNEGARAVRTLADTLTQLHRAARSD